MLMQSVLTSLIEFSVDAHLRDLRHTMSNTPCLFVSLLISMCQISSRAKLAKCCVPAHTSRSEQFGK